MTREPIYAALFQFFANLTSGGSPLFKTATRQLAHWDDVSAESCPALLFQQRRETAKKIVGRPIIWSLDVVLFIYVRTNAKLDSTVIPAQILNPLLDAIEAAVAVDNFQRNTSTLGGLVTDCSINGNIEIFQGNLGDEEVATVPLIILENPA